MADSALLEATQPEDSYRNYCLWDYRPVAPTEGKLRPVGLFLDSCRRRGLEAEGKAWVEALRGGIGPFQTVFGIKQSPDGPVWELYFYDYARLERRVSMTRVLSSLESLVPCTVPVNESLPYFMFSIDLDAALLRGERGINSIHMYIGNPGSRVSSGIAYELSSRGTTLENFYFFFDARRERQAAIDKIACSAHLDATAVDLDRVLRPELRRCHTICVANKPGWDTVYFSGVDVGQLRFFLNLLRYPAEWVDFAERNQHRLDHLLFDVGFDYRSQGGELVMGKSGYYAVF